MSAVGLSASVSDTGAIRTSALDAKSERLVQEALNKDLKGTTTIIIALKDQFQSSMRIRFWSWIKGVWLEKDGMQTVANAVYREIYETQKKEGIK